jgi:hypothetical protein
LRRSVRDADFHWRKVDDITSRQPFDLVLDRTTPCNQCIVLSVRQALPDQRTWTILSVIGRAFNNAETAIGASLSNSAASVRNSPTTMLILLDTCVNSSVELSVAEREHAHETCTSPGDASRCCGERFEVGLIGTPPDKPQVVRRGVLKVMVDAKANRMRHVVSIQSTRDGGRLHRNNRRVIEKEDT